MNTFHATNETVTTLTAGIWSTGTVASKFRAVKYDVVNSFFGRNRLDVMGKILTSMVGNDGDIDTAKLFSAFGIPTETAKPVSFTSGDIVLSGFVFDSASNNDAAMVEYKAAIVEYNAKLQEYNNATIANWEETAKSAFLDTLSKDSIEIRAMGAMLWAKLETAQKLPYRGKFDTRKPVEPKSNDVKTFLFFGTVNGVYMLTTGKSAEFCQSLAIRNSGFGIHGKSESAIVKLITGKEETGKEETGEDETGEDETGEDETGEEETGEVLDASSL